MLTVRPVAPAPATVNPTVRQPAVIFVDGDSESARCESSAIAQVALLCSSRGDPLSETAWCGERTSNADKLWVPHVVADRRTPRRRDPDRADRRSSCAGSCWSFCPTGASTSASARCVAVLCTARLQQCIGRPDGGAAEDQKVIRMLVPRVNADGNELLLGAGGSSRRSSRHLSGVEHHHCRVPQGQVPPNP